MPSSPENNRLKVRASGYAKSFLAQKYREEYQELYDAYLINRGFTPRRAKQKQDERKLLDNKE